jgi:hypothetical protein
VAKRLWADLKLPFSIVAGQMDLALESFKELAPGDVLLPTTYPAREGRLGLKYPGFGIISLQVDDFQAKVLDWTWAKKESQVVGENKDIPVGEAAPENGSADAQNTSASLPLVNTAELEMPLG